MADLELSASSAFRDTVLCSDHYELARSCLSNKAYYQTDLICVETGSSDLMDRSLHVQRLQEDEWNRWDGSKVPCIDRQGGITVYGETDVRSTRTIGSWKLRGSAVYIIDPFDIISSEERINSCEKVENLEKAKQACKRISKSIFLWKNTLQKNK